MALTSAWSTQFPQIFRTFPQPPPLPQFRPFFQDPATQPRFYMHHQPQFRHPLHNVMTSYQPSPPAPPTAGLPSLRELLPLPVASVADVHHHHHHHHVFHYYYLPADVVATGRNELGRNAREPCDLVTVAGCPQRPVPTTSPQPGYLPPPSPSPPTLTPAATTVAPPPTQPPCNDDSVVVDNVDYFPFGRSPIVVTSSVGTTSVKGHGTAGNPHPDSRVQENVGSQKSKANFVLANYLLPPDK